MGWRVPRRVRSVDAVATSIRVSSRCEVPPTRMLTCAMLYPLAFAMVSMLDEKIKVELGSRMMGQ